MTSTYTLAQMDATKWLQTLPDESVDLCITDYAYESLEEHRSIGTTTRLKQSDGSSNEWFQIFKNERVPEFLTELYRVLKKNSHLYMITDQKTMFDVVRPFGRQAGFRFWKSLTWVKVKGKDDKKPINLIEVPASIAIAEEVLRQAMAAQGCHTPEHYSLTPEEVVGIAQRFSGPEFESLKADLKIGMGYHWRNTKEEISFLEKGKRKLNKLGWSDVIPAPRIDHGYPTEKPVSLLMTLIENSSNPGELVIDPFMGSGSCGEAALLLGRNFAGNDISAKSLACAREKLSPLGTEVELPRREASILEIMGGMQ